MADALDQAVETVEEQMETPPPPAGEDGLSAPETSGPNAASPATEQDVETAEPTDAESAPDVDGDTVVMSPPPEPEPTPKPEPQAEPSKKNKTGIPKADLGEPQTPLDPIQFPPVTLNNRYLISPSTALPELNSPSAHAYGVEDQREPGRHLFALICKPGLPIRTTLMAELKKQGVTGMLPMIDYGPVFWAPIDQMTIALIMERPLGGRFLDAFGDRAPRINEYELSRLILEPLSHAISALASMDFAHRAIRLDNLFFMDRDRRELVVGECLTSPPGFDQPIIYEPLDRAYAMPSGRGYGFSYDDMYALGIITVFTLLGYNPVAKLSDDDLLAAKAELGSYQCMCGGERIPMTWIEPLRGLLSDEEFERWNIESLTTWMNGQKKTPIQRRPAPKPKTAFKFAGRDHVTTRSIAHAFSKNVAEAIKVIKNGKLEQWLRGSLGDTELSDTLTSVITMNKAHENTLDGSDDVFVSKVCMRLDPRAPVRYKNYSFMPDGFGTALAVEYLRKGNYQVPGEILARELLGHWCASQHHQGPDINALNKSFQTLRGFAKINEMGYGMERCMYELNRDLACQSELLRSTYVTEIEQLLPALDEVSDHVDKTFRPMDKHIAAYIATHFKYDITPHLKAVSDAKEETSLIGMVSLLALMQWRMKIKTLFGLSSWIGGLLSPAIGTYHSRTTRRKIEQEIPALVRQGSLPELFDLIDNAERRTIDAHDFEDAQIAFAHAEAEIEGIAGEGVDQKKVALQTGERVTAMIAVGLSMLATTIIIFVQTL